MLARIFPTKTVHAHCDIPCGIYTAQPAQTAADTIMKMTEKIQQLALPDWNNKEAVQTYENSVSRFVLVKEEHARKCKEELLILWTDYFKPEHLQMFPGLHEKFWNAAKLCSKAKQEVNMQSAKDLKAIVQEIAEIFSKAQEAQKP